MKFKITKCIFAVLAFTFVLTGCSNENELASVATTKVEEGYVVNDGYVKFKNRNEYRALYSKLSSASDLELSIWTNNLPFKSLESKYKKDNINTYVFEESLTDDLNFKRNTKRVNAVLAALYNESGIMVINDTIYKIKDEYLFKITNGDFDLLDKIDNDIDFKNTNLSRCLHTQMINPTTTKNPDGMQKSISDRTNMFSISKNRREFVTFDAYISNGFVNFDLRGYWQNRVVFVWLTPAEDELHYGQINATGTLGGNVNTNNPILYGYKVINMNFYVGAPAYATFNLNVTYNYQKNGGVASSAGSFTKQYISYQF